MGFKVKQAVEIDPAAAQTYVANVSREVTLADARKVRPCGRCEVLIATPPCQSYSSLNRRRSNERGSDLCLEVGRWASTTRPKIVVVENVPQFLKSPACNRMIGDLEKQRFEVVTMTVNARDFGVPQNRVRALVIASKVGQPNLDACVFPAARSVEWALDGLVLQPDGRNNHVAPIPSPQCLARIRLIPKGGDIRDLHQLRPDLVPLGWTKTKGKIIDIWGRLSMEKPSNTVRTEFQHPSRGRYIHPTEDRVISLREAARLQSVPDRFHFFGYSVEISRQIGNAVPFFLGGAVARAVRERLDS